eukprot:scaffold31942_cov40-Cyclotella_meneghiniana.AAC.2
MAPRTTTSYLHIAAFRQTHILFRLRLICHCHSLHLSEAREMSDCGVDDIECWVRADIVYLLL